MNSSPPCSPRSTTEEEIGTRPSTPTPENQPQEDPFALRNRVVDPSRYIPPTDERKKEIGDLLALAQTECEKEVELCRTKKWYWRYHLKPRPTEYKLIHEIEWIHSTGVDTQYYVVGEYLFINMVVPSTTLI
jgi:hypothetical protein